MPPGGQVYLERRFRAEFQDALMLGIGSLNRSNRYNQQTVALLITSKFGVLEAKYFKIKKRCLVPLSHFSIDHCVYYFACIY